MTHLENYSGWDMAEHMNQDRMISPSEILPEQLKMIFRLGNLATANTFAVRNVGAATKQLVAESMQYTLDNMDPKIRRVQALALVAERIPIPFVSRDAGLVVLYIGHLTGTNEHQSELHCSEVLELGRWQMDDPDFFVETHPTKPVRPIITPKAQLLPKD